MQKIFVKFLADLEKINIYEFQVDKRLQIAIATYVFHDSFEHVLLGNETKPRAAFIVFLVIIRNLSSHIVRCRNSEISMFLFHLFMALKRTKQNYGGSNQDFYEGNMLDFV